MHQAAHFISKRKVDLIQRSWLQTTRVLICCIYDLATSVDSLLSFYFMRHSKTQSKGQGLSDMSNFQNSRFKASIDCT